jgi:hypothetical protein
VWYGGVAGEGLRSVGEDYLPSSKSVCSILPIARGLSDRGFRALAFSLAALLSDLTEGAAFALSALRRLPSCDERHQAVVLFAP